MSLVFRGFTPHPPIIIPKIGRADIEQVDKTVGGMKEMVKKLKEKSPQVLIFTTPHGHSFRDSFSFITTNRVKGDFGRFGYPKIDFSVNVDTKLTDMLMKEAEAKGIETVSINDNSSEKYGVTPQLDHGVMVPLYYIMQQMQDFEVVVIAVSGLDGGSHQLMGEVIKKVCDGYDKKVALIGSGDLSHKLTESAPAGYHPEAYMFDEAIVENLKTLDFDKINNIEAKLIRRAGECGLRSIHVLIGSMKDDRKNIKPQVHSYEGPFGVGYAVFSAV